MTGVMRIGRYNPDADVDPERTARCAAALLAAGVPGHYVHRLGDGQVGLSPYRAEFFLAVRLGRDGDWTYRGAWGPVARANDIECASAAEAVNHARYHGYFAEIVPAEDGLPAVWSQ